MAKNSPVKKADPPDQKSTDLEVQAEAQENLGQADTNDGPPPRSKLWVDEDGEPTDQEYYRDSPTGEWKRNLIRPTQTHGAIARDPNANMDRASSVVADASIREIYQPGPPQAGEDPGRVMDAAGLHSGAAARAPSNPSNPMTGGVPHLERNRDRPPHPRRPVDSPANTAAAAAAGVSRMPVDGPGRIEPPPGAPDLPDASTGTPEPPGVIPGGGEFDPNAKPKEGDVPAAGEKPLFPS